MKTGAVEKILFAIAFVCIGWSGARGAKVDARVELLQDVNVPAVRRMIADLRASYPDRFTRADEFLARLAEQEKKLDTQDLEQFGKAADQIRLLQREIAFANPLLNAQPIVFVVRNQYAPDHHNTETLFQTGEPNCRSYRPGGALKLLDPATEKISVLVDPGLEGLVRDPEVHFDGRKVIFSMRKARNKNHSIYELEVDPKQGYALVPGSLKRLTNEPDATDIDPLYLPDGKIIFSSTRQPKYCHCNMHIMANLHRMEGDGANIHQIGTSTLFEGHASLMPDGRVMYYRWEYVDRNYGDAQGLWTVNPDGTNHAIYWKNNMASPGAVFDGRAIPGTNLAVCIFGSCHDRPWGALAIIDRSKGIDSPDAVVRIWPESARALVKNIEGFAFDDFRGEKSRYEDPFPLVDPATGTGGKYFLVSRSLKPLPFKKADGQPAGVSDLRMGLYLVDTFGNEILLHEETPGCFDPMPLAVHPRPKALPDRRNYRDATGTMYVSDVYQGTHMQGVKRGDVASLRVVESREKRFWTGPTWSSAQYKTLGTAGVRPAISWAGFEVKQILGTVPVEADGSAYFEVPADKFVYFQLLDRDGMLISTMRSGAQVRPGELQGCIGCHEDRLSSYSSAGKQLLALRRPPVKLEGWKGSIRPFGYLKEIQPIWDRHCVQCHDFGKKAGEKLILAGDKELVYNASYVQLFKNWGTEKALLNTVGLGLANFNPAYAVGSHRSRLVEMLKKGQGGGRLSADEMDRIITWIDIGGPYYPDYACSHPDGLAGRAPLSPAKVSRLGTLTGVPLIGNTDSRTHTLQVSLDRPELSPCLQKLDKAGDAYREALAILKAGQEELRANPDADQPGFKCCKAHQAREDTYQKMRQREQNRCKAITEGRKVYDEGIGRP